MIYAVYNHNDTLLVSTSKATQQIKDIKRRYKERESIRKKDKLGILKYDLYITKQYKLYIYNN